MDKGCTTYRNFRTKYGIIFSCGDCVHCKLNQNDYPCNQCYKELKDNGVKIPFITGEKFQHKDKAYENKLTDLIKKHKTTISELYDELIDNSITLDFFIFKLFETTNQKYAMEHLKLKDTPIIKRKRVKKH